MTFYRLYVGIAQGQGYLQFLPERIFISFSRWLQTLAMQDNFIPVSRIEFYWADNVPLGWTAFFILDSFVFFLTSFTLTPRIQPLVFQHKLWGINVSQASAQSLNFCYFKSLRLLDVMLSEAKLSLAATSFRLTKKCRGQRRLKFKTCLSGFWSSPLSFLR